MGGDHQLTARRAMRLWRQQHLFPCGVPHRFWTLHQLTTTLLLLPPAARARCLFHCVTGRFPTPADPALGTLEGPLQLQIAAAQLYYSPEGRRTLLYIHGLWLVYWQAWRRVPPPKSLLLPLLRWILPPHLLLHLRRRGGR